MRIASQTVFVVYVATRQGLQIEGIFANVDAAGTAVDALLGENDRDDSYDTIFSVDEAPEWAGAGFLSTFQDEDEAFHTSDGKLIWAVETPVQD